jgi:hypothetical protein
LLSLLAANVAALEWDLTVGGGVSLPGEIVATDDLEQENFRYEISKPTALLARAALDLYPLPWLGGSVFVYAGAAPLNEGLSLGFWDGCEHTIPASGIAVLEIGGSLKGRLEIGERRYVKPSVGLGYLHSFSDSPDARMDGFVVNGELEYEHPLCSWLSGVAQLGFAVQPYGGVKDVAYVTFGPLFYLTLGLVL